MTDAHGEVGDLHLATVVVNVQDMRRAVDFWSAALGYRPREERWNPEFMMLEDPDRQRLPVSLQRTDEPSARPVRVHLDLYTDHQQRHVQRLVALGAEQVDDWPYPDDCDFVVLRDPDGNEFCVIDHADLQSSGPRAARAFDPGLHRSGTTAAQGGCSHHEAGDDPACTGEAVVSFRDESGRWQSGCAPALEQLVEAGSVQPLGQGA
jgi:catechol 2,3-dioxygenase-like lactoylglutathione lyase family enzyme